MSGSVLAPRENSTGGVAVWFLVLAQPFIIAGLKLASGQAALAAPFVFFSTAVVFSAVAAGIRAGLLVTGLSAFLASLLFLTPSWTIIPATHADAALIAFFVVEGAVLSVVTGTLRNALLRTRRAHKTAPAVSRR